MAQLLFFKHTWSMLSPREHAAPFLVLMLVLIGTYSSPSAFELWNGNSTSKSQSTA